MTFGVDGGDSSGRIFRYGDIGRRNTVVFPPGVSRSFRSLKYRHIFYRKKDFCLYVLLAMRHLQAPFRPTYGHYVWSLCDGFPSYKIFRFPEENSYRLFRCSATPIGVFIEKSREKIPFGSCGRAAETGIFPMQSSGLHGPPFCPLFMYWISGCEKFLAESLNKASKISVFMRLSDLVLLYRILPDMMK